MSAYSFTLKKLPFPPLLRRSRAPSLYPKEAGAAATRADVEMFFVKSRHADEGIAALCPGGVTQSWRINSRQTPQAPPLPFPSPMPSERNEVPAENNRRMPQAYARAASDLNSRQTPQAPPLPFPSLPSRDNELGHAHDRRRQRIRHLRRKHVAKRAHVFDELFVDVVLFVVEPVRGDRLVAPRDGGRRR